MAKMHEVECAYCGKNIFRSEQQIKNSKTGLFYCDKKCVGKHRTGNKIVVPNFNCAYCNEPLYRRPSVVALSKSGLYYCNKDCRGKNETKIYKVECSECGKSIERKGNDIHLNSDRYFCDCKCSNKYYNRKRDLKINYNCDYCGKSFKIQESQKKNNKKTYCSVDCKNKDHYSFVGGENNAFWNPNLTDEERLTKRKSREYNQWRISVFKRDNYKCIKCGGNKKINAHHIYNHYKYLDLRTDVNNGVTFCTQCHKDFHRKYGKKDNNEEQLKDFLKTP